MFKVSVNIFGAFKAFRALSFEVGKGNIFRKSTRKCHVYHRYTWIWKMKAEQFGNNDSKLQNSQAVYYCVYRVTETEKKGNNDFPPKFPPKISYFSAF